MNIAPLNHSPLHYLRTQKWCHPISAEAAIPTTVTHSSRQAVGKRSAIEPPKPRSSIYPTMTFFDLDSIGSGLPVMDSVPAIESALLAAGSVIVQAPPGTGKTTVIPPLISNILNKNRSSQCNQGKVIVVVPRRVAVRAAAQRLIFLDGLHKNSGSVGFSMRGESRRGKLIEFVTPGVLLRRLLSDPELPGVSAVIVDEVHERQLDTDLVLGMLIELRELRPDLFLAVMSATVDAHDFSRLVGAAPIVTVNAVTHPVNIDYRPAPGRSDFSQDYTHHLASVTAHAVSQSEYSALVFVPGVREVSALCAALEATTHVKVLPLHGQLSSTEQEAALSPAEQRIVVSTSIAESSLTVPGVRIVVDTGLSRIPKRDAGRGMSGLVTVSTSQSSADQRAGRAGREGPGHVLRCYSAQEFSRFSPHIPPEISSADLTQAALFLASWGAPRGEGFPLLTAPPAVAMEQAVETLTRLGALDSSGYCTELGRTLATLPADPRLGKSLLECGTSAIPTVAALSTNIRGDVSKEIQNLAGQRHYELEKTRLEKLISHRHGEPSSRNHSYQEKSLHSEPVSPGEAIGRAFPENIARADGESYLLAKGTRAFLRNIPSLSGSPWLAISEVALSQGPHNHAVIHTAAAIDKATALEIIGVSEDTTATFAEGKLRGTRVTRAGAIVLSSTPCALEGDSARKALKEIIQSRGLNLFNFSEKALTLKNRLRHLHNCYGDPWPNLDSVTVQEWLAPEIDYLLSGTPIAKVDMYPALQRLLPWPEATHLEELAPSTLNVPSGRNASIDYSGERPKISIKLQECFGLQNSPIICGQPLQFQLLSPAGRPLAVTDDLHSFWGGPYHHVRSEMRGRYPKHPWPEDPTTALATGKTKKALS
ncbi:ATP-dependent helicase HrpB [Corynebacterium pseudotuberculosis]|nr:ATP-dependent helicase HrpB [Corynebacterium pseudotuberculosis]